MKKVTSITLLSIIVFLAGINSVNISAQTKDNLKGNISISGAFALYPVTIRWSEEFRKVYPNVQIDISAGGAGKGITDVLSGITNIGLVSRDIYPDELKKGAYPIAVTKDAVVPTISASNPKLDVLLKQGLKKNDFVNIFINGKIKSWSQIIKTNISIPVRVYTRSDAAGAAETWAKYLGDKKQEDLIGIGVFGDPGLAQAVKKDPGGIGYNNIVYVYDSQTKKQTNGVRIIPIDLNENGKIDHEENFYDNINQIIKAIGEGKYPSPPARDLYFVTKGNPKNNKVVQEFIKWVLKEGQKYIQEAGYINLPESKIKSEFDKIK